MDTVGSISYLVVRDLDRIGRDFSKVCREISRLKGGYGISILPVLKRMELKNVLQKEIKKK